MTIPLRVTYRHLDSSTSLDALIRTEVEKLDEFFDRVVACKVVVEQPHQRHRQGKHFRVHVELDVPNGVLVADRDPAKHRSHEDPRIAVTEAFKAAGRQLQDYAQRIRLDVKRHSTLPARRAASLEPMVAGTLLPGV